MVTPTSSTTAPYPTLPMPSIGAAFSVIGRGRTLSLPWVSGRVGGPTLSTAHRDIGRLTHTLASPSNNREPPNHYGFRSDNRGSDFRLPATDDPITVDNMDFGIGFPLAWLTVTD